MISFSDLKEYLCRIFSGTPSSSNDDYDITFTIRQRLSTVDSDSNAQTINHSELFELYNSLEDFTITDSSMYNGHYYEVAVDTDSSFFRRYESPEILLDNTNGYSYELSPVSAKYSLSLIILAADFRNAPRETRQLYSADRFRLGSSRYLQYGNSDILTLEQLLQQIVHEYSIKICSQNSTSIVDFKKLVTSFCFEFMFQTQIALIEYKDMTNIITRPRMGRTSRRNEPLDKPPLRVYSEDVVDYYKKALSADDPYIKYISFYHVIEYFYDEIFKEKMILDLKDRITQPDFSYKDNNKIYDMALFIKNRWKANSEDGQGDEKESLKYVLTDFIQIDKLKFQISTYDLNAVEYYQNNKVSFSDAPSLPWNDERGIITQLAHRIYFTRNSLVHSKSGKNNKRYKPYKNEQELKKEIPLIQSIAALIIINSSQTL